MVGNEACKMKDKKSKIYSNGSIPRVSNNVIHDSNSKTMPSISDILFEPGELPEDQIKTVGSWLNKLKDDVRLFGKSLQKNALRLILKKKRKSIESVNQNITSMNEMLNDSVDTLLNYRQSLSDYVIACKAAVKENEAKRNDIDVDSDSSVEIIDIVSHKAKFDNVKPTAEESNKILPDGDIAVKLDSSSDDESNGKTGSNNDEKEEENKSEKEETRYEVIKNNEDDSKLEEKRVYLRVRRLSELNSGTIHSSGSSPPNSTVTTSVEENLESVQASKPPSPASEDTPTVESPASEDTPTVESQTEPVESAQSTSGESVKKSSTSKSPRKNTINWSTTSDSDSNGSDESWLRTSSRSRKAKGLCLEKMKETHRKLKESILTSSASSSDTDVDRLLVKESNFESCVAQSNKICESSKMSRAREAKGLCLKKMEETQKKLRESIFTSPSCSSSDADVHRLCDMKSLKMKRKRSSSSSSTSSKPKANKPPAKKPLKKTIAPSLMDFMMSSEEEDKLKDDGSDSEIVDISFGDLKSFDNTNLVADDLRFEEPCVSSDGGLDDIFDKLEKKQKTKSLKESKKVDKKSDDQEDVYVDKSEDKKKSVRRKRDKLLDEKLTETDSSEAEEKYLLNKMKKRIESSDSDAEEKPPQKTPKVSQKTKKLRKSLFSDSDVESSEGSNFSAEEKGKSPEEDSEDSDEKKKQAAKKKRKRIQRCSDSSSNSGEDGATPSKSADGKGRRNIKRIIKEESLEKSTKEALKEEEERKKRISEKQKLYNDLCKVAIEEAERVEELVLDFDPETKKPLISVDKGIVKNLKPHQADGIKFMWDSCFESVKEAKEGKGSGCILAHCMGLGKTLQVVALVHTLLASEKVDVKTVLIVCPFSTVQNWVSEFSKWLRHADTGQDFTVNEMMKTSPAHRHYQLKDWQREGGVMVLGYSMYRTLANSTKRLKASVKKAYMEALVDPGPDIIVCDEGHVLKNESTALSKTMTKLRTRRRIVLTGTPLQNNLLEYHCMVQFVKPNLLGTRKEFQNRFVHPIQNGQFEDSTAHDVKVMKKRAHVLHKMLDGIVQRKDYNVLTPYLPPKHEYVIHLKLTEVQCKLYRHYLINFARNANGNEVSKGSKLFTDFQQLLRICSHPRALLIHSDKETLKKEYSEDSEGSLKDFIDDGSDSNSSSADSDNGSGGSSKSGSKTPPPSTRRTRANPGGAESESDIEEVPPRRTEWWSSIVSDAELEDLSSSPKIFLFFTILKHCYDIGDKLLVFSQSLYSLDLLEYFLGKIDENNRKNDDEKNPALSPYDMDWDKGHDYFRLDGTVSADMRTLWCNKFNVAKNRRARLFLISTRAGGMGINLTGANRVIIYDASWNPSFDVQSMFRVYRFGQDKPCYIYRFLSKGTIEEKIYERQVAKLSTALRVIDEHQIDRHFSQNSLAELYAFNPDPPESTETPLLPKDRLMAELLQAHKDIIMTHHQHDSLLENQMDEELDEEDRKTAWLEFENEKNYKPPPQTYYYGPQQPTGLFDPSMLNYGQLLETLVTKVRASNPQMSEDALRSRAREIITSLPVMQFQQQQLQQQQIQQQYVMQQQRMMMQQKMMATPNSFMANLPVRGPNNMIAGAGQNRSTLAPKRAPAPAAGSSKKPPEQPQQLIEIHDDE